MATTVTELDDWDNFFKYLLFHYETGAKVCFRVLSWLYKGKSPIEFLVVDLAYAKEIIIDGAEEKDMVDELENGNIRLCDLDLTLLYKITQSVCGLKKKNNNVWSKRCHPDDRGELEYLLFSLNNGQNDVKNITESDLVKKSEELRLLLAAILQQAGQKTNVDVHEVKEVILKMQLEFQDIFNNDKFDASTKYHKCGSNVVIQILDWLYKGLSPIEHLVIDLTKLKTIQADGTDIIKLERLKNKKIKLSDLDITFLYKVIQAVCGLKERNEDIWSNHCPVDKQDELEYLLFKLKHSRNDVAHPDPKLKNMTDLDIDVKSKEMKSLLTSIVEKAGQIANIDVQEVRDAVTLIQNDIERIRNNDKIDDSMKPHILNQILNDLKFSYEAELKSSFEKELKGYSAPYLRHNNSKSKIHLRDLLTFEDQIIVVQGETGEGKTSLTRFLYNSWLSGNTDIMKILSSFEVVLRIDCNQISSSDIILFFEEIFPIASSAFPKKVSLKKSFAEFRVLWIMDGFDECTAAFKEFLTAMTKSLSEKHKLLITTRPHTYEDLKKYLRKLSMASFTLELLEDPNVMEIVKNLIIEKERIKQFTAHFNSRDEPAKYLLRNPLNINLYIKLWMQNPELVRNTYTTKLLFLKTISNNLSLLQERLDGRTCWSSEDLKDNVKDWLFGSLCKQSFLMLMNNRLNFITKEDLDTLRKDARDSKLDPSSCLSTFLVQKREDYEGETRYKFFLQYMLASLFLKHFKDYNGENVINSSITDYGSNWQNRSLRIITFYMGMIKEDGSLDTDLTQVFSPIKKIVDLCKDNFEDKFYLWFNTSVASNFNKKYMKNVSFEIKGILCFELHKFFRGKDLFNLTTFFTFVRPQKIILSELLATTRKPGFESLRNLLIKYNIEIELNVNNIATEDFYIQMENGSGLTKVSINRPVDDELWINFDCFYFLAGFPTQSQESVENTTLRLFKINESNFEEAYEFLNRIKGEEASKFKTLCHDFDNISETGKLQLLKIAHEVFDDPIYQLKEFCIQQIEHLNVTTFRGTMSMLGIFKTHHASLKSIFLEINSEDSFCRMLAFLQENKTTLSEVSITLSTLQHWERRTFFDENRTLESQQFSKNFTIPIELVQKTTLYISIDEINEDNFKDYFTLLNNVKGDETLKFKSCSYPKLILSPDKRKMLDELSNNSTFLDDSIQLWDEYMQNVFNMYNCHMS